MTLTEALARYTVRHPDDVPITSDRVAIEFDVTAGQRTLSPIIIEIGDDPSSGSTRPGVWVAG